MLRVKLRKGMPFAPEYSGGAEAPPSCGQCFAPIAFSPD